VPAAARGQIQDGGLWCREAGPLDDPGRRWHPSCVGHDQTPFSWHSPDGSAKQPESLSIS
jgi:hypothetical protein